jgi:hypothetical protein
MVGNTVLVSTDGAPLDAESSDLVKIASTPAAIARLAAAKTTRRLVAGSRNNHFLIRE